MSIQRQELEPESLIEDEEEVPAAEEEMTDDPYNEIVVQPQLRRMLSEMNRGISHEIISLSSLL